MTTSKLRLVGECAQCRVVSAADAPSCRSCGTTLDGASEQVVDPVRLGIWGFPRPLNTHCLACPPIAPIRLRQEQRYVIGRSEDTDITLPGELVSRSHSAITYVNGEFRVEDLGSANGTLHNEVKITAPIKLENGDVITIGGFKIQYQVRMGEDTSQAEILEKIHGHTTVSEEDALDAEPEVDAEAMSGILGDVFLLQVLSYLSINKISGRLVVEAVDSEGVVHFDEGEIVDAQHSQRHQETTGKSALGELVQLTEGAFKFHERVWTGNARIDERADSLLSSL